MTIMTTTARKTTLMTFHVSDRGLVATTSHWDLRHNERQKETNDVDWQPLGFSSAPTTPTPSHKGHVSRGQPHVDRRQLLDDRCQEDDVITRCPRRGDAVGPFAADICRVRHCCAGLVAARQQLQPASGLERLLLLVGCLTSQQHATVSQGRICTDNFTCCHTEMEAADQTFHLTQSQYTDTGPTSPSADPITPGAWQGSHWSASF